MVCNDVEWHYRGEGNCALVVADPQNRKVYRLVKKYFTQRLNQGSCQDTFVSKRELIDAALRHIVDYVRNVMQPLLYSKYVDSPEMTVIEDIFVKKVQPAVSDSRPVHRRNTSPDTLDGVARSALVLPDVCFISQTPEILECNKEHDVTTISIEIKPKKALLPHYQLQDGGSPVKRQVCKFCMHQKLKVKEYKWPQTSQYCPLDLFSGNRARMLHALLCLIKTPQNNLKICQNGTEVYGAGAMRDLGAVLKDFFGDSGQCKNSHVLMFLDLVIEILLSTQQNDNLLESTMLKKKCYNSSFVSRNGESLTGVLPPGCVLERIFTVQAMDHLHIQNILPLYQKILTHLEHHPEDRLKWGLDGPYTRELWPTSTDSKRDLCPSSIEYAVDKVKRFLISKTVQDCSVIVAIQPCRKGISKENSTISMNSQCFSYSIALVDLDPKPFDKIQSYYLQDLKITKAFQETFDLSTDGNESSDL
ncbi:inositol-pentakisphosphate 2-kinase-like [Gigantopelta aegis]|uniref:inositol-pentakisphosphate 2-kinase-like n=1 Tax=Gigantopelta aegis TaxID=1735272 RepID=UPI001B88E39F|nr:inositol-pentakisphosphate 2-kinase-like [Gigantopelta aegis]